MSRFNNHHHHHHHHHHQRQPYFVRVTLNSKDDKTSGPHFRIELEFDVLVSVEGGKPENPRKPLGTGTRANNKLHPHVTPGPGIQPGRATLVGGERSHHCVIPALPEKFSLNFSSSSPNYK